jgi:phenylpropionate dioxygenase-like ring-hydroxylating dioxygenase large terminal subunit
VDLLTNLDPCLAHGWHPVARAHEVSAAPLTVRLLGRDHVVSRTSTGLASDAYDSADHAGLVWLAPAAPHHSLLDMPEAEDPRFSSGWLAPQEATTSAGLLADNFLDVAHFPFVHAQTFGSDEDTLVPPYDVTSETEGFSVIYEHAYRNVEDPGVTAGIRPLVQRRRVTYRYKAPFQLRLRLDHLDTSTTTVILFLLQPVDLGRTRIWCQVLRDDLAGTTMEQAVAFEQAVLDEDKRLSARFLLPGLPLHLNDEMHTRADASGVALRRALRHLRESFA